MESSDGIWNDFELQRTFWKQGRLILHSDVIWNDFELQRKKWTPGRLMVHYGGIWNDLELYRKNWKLGRCMVHSDGIWYFGTADTILKTRTINGAFWLYLIRYWTSENILKTRTLNGAFWRHFKKIETAEKKKKTRTLNGAFWRHSKLFGTAVKNIEIKENKWWILTVFETILNCRDFFLNKTLNGAFWRYLKRFRTAEIILTQDTFACIIVTHSETIFETALKRNSTCFDLTKGREILKIRAVNGAFCRYL